MSTSPNDDAEVPSEVVITRGFTAIPNAILEADISPTAFKVYCAVRSFGRGAEPSAFPKMETVCERFHIPARTFSRALKELEEAGMIVITKRAWAGGMRRSNLYTFPDWPLQLANLASRDHANLASREDALLASPEEEDSPKKKTQVKNTTSIPEGWTPTEASLSWAKEKHPRLNVSRETEKFVNYHRAKGTRYKDWQQAFRNWMDNAEDFARPAAPTALRPVPDNTPRSAAFAREMGWA